MSSCAGCAEMEPVRETLHRPRKLAKRRASPCFATGQKGTKVLLGVVDACQIDIGDARDRKARRGRANFVRERVSIRGGQRAHGGVAGYESARELGARLGREAPVVDTHREVVGEAAARGLLEIEDRGD